MSDHCFSSFNFPYTSSVDLRQFLLDYGKPGQLHVYRDEESSVKCISQTKNITQNTRLKLRANKPTLPLGLPNKVCRRFDIEETDRAQLRNSAYHRNIANFRTDRGDILYGSLADLVSKEVSSLSRKNYPGNRNRRSLRSFLGRFDDKFCEIPVEVLDDLLLESFEEDRFELAGKYYGNCLVHQTNISSGDPTIVLAYPCGELMDKFTASHLELCSDHDGGLVAKLLPGKDYFSFPGKIRQINTVNLNHTSSVLAVRSDYSCSFFTYKCEQDEEPTMTNLGNLVCKTKPCSVAVNPFIHGEVVVAMETGSLYLWSEKGSNLQVVKRCSASVVEEFDWYWCEFGSHPRQVIRGNATNVEFCDLRDSSSGGKDLITLPSPHFYKDEQFSAIQRHPENPYHYYLATDQTLVIMDERFQENPVLKWCHSLEGSIKQINVVPNVFPDCKDVMLIVGGYKNHEVHCYQYCYGENTLKSLQMGTNMGGLPPRSTTSPWKVSSYSEWPEMVEYPNKAELLPEITSRLSQPLLGLTSIKHVSDNIKTLSILQLSKAGDLFYQCLSPQENTLKEERDQQQLHFYEEFDVDHASSSGCGSLKIVLAEKDKDLVQNWLNSTKEQMVQENTSALQESSHTFHFVNAGFIREKIFSLIKHNSQCTLCDGILTSNQVAVDGELEGKCYCCGLDKTVSEKLNAIRTTETVVLTNAYLGTNYEPNQLELFDVHQNYTDHLGLVLLKNWSNEEQTPVQLGEEPQADITKDEGVTEAKYQIKTSTSGSQIPESIVNETRTVTTKDNCHAELSETLGNGKVLTTPKTEKPRKRKECAGPTTSDFSSTLENHLTNTPLTRSFSPAINEGSPRKSSFKKKKLPRIAGF